MEIKEAKITEDCYYMPRDYEFNKMSACPKIIWMYLFDDYIHSHKSYSDLSIEKLCKKVNLSEPTVLKGIKELEDNGYLKVDRKRKGGNKYYLLMLK